MTEPKPNHFVPNFIFKSIEFNFTSSIWIWIWSCNGGSDGEGSLWPRVPRPILRCGHLCRLRWISHLRLQRRHLKVQKRRRSLALRTLPAGISIYIALSISISPSKCCCSFDLISGYCIMSIFGLYLVELELIEMEIDKATPIRFLKFGMMFFHLMNFRFILVGLELICQFPYLYWNGVRFVFYIYIYVWFVKFWHDVFSLDLTLYHVIFGLYRFNWSLRTLPVGITLFPFLHPNAVFFCDTICIGVFVTVRDLLNLEWCCLNLIWYVIM